MSTRLILIRHGETDWSREKRYCGVTDACLNKRGVEQAGRLCERLGKEGIDKIYSSDLKRALESARIIFKEREIEAAPGLREMNFGIFEGLTYEELMERHPEVYANWLNNPFEADIPEGEEWKGFEGRVKSALDKIIVFNKNKTVALVTHAGPIKVIMGDVTRTKDILEINPELGSFRSCVYG